MCFKTFKKWLNGLRTYILKLVFEMYLRIKNLLRFNRASVSGHMDVIYVRMLLPYAEKFDPGRMTYVQSLSVTSA